MVQVRRTKFLINKKLQVQFASLAFIVLGISMAGVWGMMHFVLQHALNAGWNLHPFLTKSTYAIWAFILVDAAVVGVLTIFFSHFIVGPIYKLENTLRALVEGDHVVPFALRRKDALQTIIPVVNQIIERWNSMQKESGNKGKRVR